MSAGNRSSRSVAFRFEPGERARLEAMAKADDRSLAAVEPLGHLIARALMWCMVAAIAATVLLHACGCGPAFTLAPAAAGDGGQQADAGPDLQADGGEPPDAELEVPVDGGKRADADAELEVPLDGGEPPDTELEVPVDAAPALCCRTQGATDTNITFTPTDAGELGASCRVLAFAGVVTACPKGS